MVVEAYRAALGRDPSRQELRFWVLYPETPTGIVNTGSLSAALLRTLKNSPAERESTARRALLEVFAAELAASPQALRYIEDPRNAPLRHALATLRAGRDGGGFRGLVAWLSRVHDRFIAETGLAEAMAGVATNR